MDNKVYLAVSIIISGMEGDERHDDTDVLAVCKSREKAEEIIEGFDPEDYMLFPDCLGPKEWDKFGDECDYPSLLRMIKFKTTDMGEENFVTYIYMKIVETEVLE